jgi:hypothetical protein
MLLQLLLTQTTDSSDARNIESEKSHTGLEICGDDGVTGKGFVVVGVGVVVVVVGVAVAAAVAAENGFVVATFDVALDDDMTLPLAVAGAVR